MLERPSGTFTFLFTEIEGRIRLAQEHPDGISGLLPWTIDGQEEVEVAYTLAWEYWGRDLASDDLPTRIYSIRKQVTLSA